MCSSASLVCLVNPRFCHGTNPEQRKQARAQNVDAGVITGSNMGTHDVWVLSDVSHAGNSTPGRGSSSKQSQAN